MTKKKSGSSRQEKRVAASALFMNPLTDRQRKELERIARMADSEIDFSDAPKTKTTSSRRVYVGRFYRPIKEQISVRVDADVLAWLRSRGKRYQTYMNDVLRRAMRSDLRRSGSSLNR
jgi:uncharacterized protein (DUF4415 family)